MKTLKLLFIVPVFIVALYSVLGALGLVHADYSELTFILLAIWLGCEAVEMVARKLSDPIEIAVERGLARALPHSFDLRVDKERRAIVQHLTDLIRCAEISIDMITWRAFHSSVVDSEVKGYLKAIEKRLMAKGRTPVTVRRLLWRPEHLDLLEKQGFHYDRHPRAVFRYWLPRPEDIEIPLMPCLIIDEKIVHFGLGYLGAPHADEVAITFRDDEVVRMFTRYFKYFWSSARPIKEGNDSINMDALDAIRRTAGVLERRLAESGSTVAGSI